MSRYDGSGPKSACTYPIVIIEHALRGGLFGCLAGLVLSGDVLPDAPLLELLKNSQLPVISSPLDSYDVASNIHSMTVKTLPGDMEKIDKIQAMIEREVRVDRLLEKIAAR